MGKTHKVIDENWLHKKWQPYMSVLYMAICAADFIVFPVLWSLIQAHDHGAISSQWQPLTLQGGGLIHLAFGAILGISAHGKSQEKIAGVTEGTTYIAPESNPISVEDSTSFSSSPAPIVSAPVALNAKGKKVIPLAPQPEL